MFHTANNGALLVVDVQGLRLRGTPLYYDVTITMRVFSRGREHVH